MDDRHSNRRPTRWILQSSLRLERVRLAVIGLIMVLNAVGNVIGYRDTYPDESSRQQFAAAFQGNLALRLFYGIPRDLASVGGYVEFRVVGIMAVLAAAWAVFAAARALRGEEDAGRWELVLCGAVTRPGATAVVLAALLLECGALWLATTASLWIVGTVPGDLTTGQAMLVAAAVVLPGVLFVALGALACQVAGSHRGAQAIGGALIAVALLLRIAADLAVGRRLATLADSVRLGRAAPPRDRRTTVGDAVVRGRGAGGRRCGGVDRRTPRPGCEPRSAPRRAAVARPPARLDQPAGDSHRAPDSVVWVVAAGTFAAILGAFAKSIADQASKIHLHAFTQVTTASGYLALSFVLFTLAVSLFATSHISAIRDDESSGRLETLFALPIARRAWFAGRLAVAAGSSVALALMVGVLAWAGAASQNSGVSLGSLVEAGANCVPAALCFLGLGALLFATFPRLSGGGALALVGIAFLWELLGALVSAPAWLLCAFAVPPRGRSAAVCIRRTGRVGHGRGGGGRRGRSGRGLHPPGSPVRMSDVMQAMVLTEPGKLELQTVEAPVAGEGEIVIEVSACGVCRTDLQIFKGDIPLRKAPLILGHQIVGRVVGSGERVGLAWLWGACGRCKQCLAGLENLCEFAEFTGWTVDGGYAQRVVAREDFVYPLPDGVDDIDAAPLLCAGIIGYRALRLSGITPGGVLGLFGFGSSAHLAIQVARHWGCEVAVFCHLDRERELAAALGAAWVGGYDDPPPAPLDAAVTFAPVGSVVVSALRATGPGGTVAINAIHLDRVPEFSYDLLWRERSLRSVANFTREDARAFLDLAVEIPIRPETTVFDLADGGDALRMLDAGEIRGSAVLRIPSP